MDNTTEPCLEPLGVRQQRDGRAPRAAEVERAAGVRAAERDVAADLGVDAKVIITPPCMFHQWFSI